MSDDDDAGIREDYLVSLQELTFNSRVIITNLTVIAQENIQAARAIVRAIEDHLHKCSPAYKLPALYLLDSICKNVGSPYTVYFGLNLFRTFTNVYTLVPEAIRKKMFELFQTWKQPSPVSGAPLFSNSEAISKIDVFLNRARAAQELHKQQEHQQLVEDNRRRQIELQRHAQHIQSAHHMSQQALRSEVDQLLELTGRRQAASPTDSEVTQKIGVLNELRDYLATTSVDPETLPQVQQQLADLARQEVEKVRSLAQSLPAPTPSPVPVPVVVAPPSEPFVNPLQGIDLSRLAASLQVPVPVPVPAPVPPSVQAPVPQTFQPQVQSFPQAQPYPPQQLAPTPGPISLDPGLLKNLQSMLQPQGSSVYIELSNKGISTDRPELIDQLYSALPRQCSTCGKRYPDTEVGNRDRQAHMDWHFRVNKRLREDSNRTQNRCWFLSESEWVDYKDETEILGLNLDQTTGNSGDIAGHLDSQDHRPKAADVAEADIRKLYVRVPTTGQTACPLCKEKFVSSWSSEAEDWVWTNAINVQGKIFHASCHHDADKDLIKRILNPSAAIEDKKPAVDRTVQTEKQKSDLASILATVNGLKRKRQDQDEPRKERVM